MIDRLSRRLASRLPFFYGYVMVPLAMMMQITTSPGQTFAFSAFTPAFRDTFAMSDSQLTFAYMLGTFLAAFPLTVVGPLSDRFGLRALSIAAVTAVAITCWYASGVQGWWTLLLTFFLLRFLGQGTLSLLSSNAVAMWYRNRIGRVSAVMSVGTAIAFAWVPGWIKDSINSVGWRETYQGIALLVGFGIVPLVMILFRNRPEEIGQTVDGVSSKKQSTLPMVPAVASNEVSLTIQQAIRSRAFWILAVTNAAWAMIGTGIVFYLYTLCELRGFEDKVPTALFKTLGMSMLAGQLGGGVLADFLRLHRMLGFGTVLLAIGAGMVALGESSISMHGFAACFGAGQGLLLAVGAVVWVRYYGRKSLGTIRGTVWCATVAGSGCGPLLMGMSLDQLGSFTPALIGFFAILSTLSIAAWFATPPQDGAA